MEGWSEKFKEAAKGALLSAADIAILEAANKLDQERDQQYIKIEDAAKERALAQYRKEQVDSRLAKATLIPRTGEEGSPINFMFNPTDLSLSRSVSITNMNGARTQRGLPKVNFGFVEPYKLTLAGILFDTYETGASVLNKIKPLLDAVDFSKFQDPFNNQTNGGNTYQERVVKVSVLGGAMNTFVQQIGGKNVLGAQEYGSENIGQQSLQLRRPPVFYFIWGGKNYMCCMVKQLDYKLTMFLPNGTPVRAMVNITLEEVDLGVASRAFSQRQKFVSD
ncbi:CIS tube protein [Microcoleus sp. OTE_8_concoct_300]|uniref:CIS tube protein n=1 Tax=Microcoleus sp. OTE_8_concoct_300 TaxID=2964710 RepID=UPI00403F265C